MSYVAQSQSDSALLNNFSNDSIKFQVIEASAVRWREGLTATPPGFYILIKGLNTKYFTKLKALPKDFWMSRLQNESYDWATNLVLYELYTKSALKFKYFIKSEEEWKSLYKDEDVKYWSEKLK